MNEKITSAQNSKIKRLIALTQKSAERRSQGVFVAEGQREIAHCLAAGLTITTLYYCPALLGSDNPSARFTLPAATRCIEVSTDLYDRMAYRGSTEGVIAEVVTPKRTLDDLHLKENALVVVLESVEKPGNLGAVLRSADAAGADAVIVCDPLTDLYNPNLIRASIGAIFTVPCVACTTSDCIAYLQNQGIRILTAQLQDSALYYATDMRGSTAIVMGTEATGLTTAWRTAADAHIRIPMLGRLDSLNVSVSAAILLYEAVRQRQG